MTFKCFLIKKLKKRIKGRFLFKIVMIFRKFSKCVTHDTYKLIFFKLIKFAIEYQFFNKSIVSTQVGKFGKKSGFRKSPKKIDNKLRIFGSLSKVGKSHEFQAGLLEKYFLTLELFCFILYFFFQFN